MVSGEQIQDLPERVLRLSKTIRNCTVIDKSGDVIASMARKNLQPLVTQQDGHRQALQAAMRYFIKPSWARNLGEMYYTASRYEKLIGATIPVGDRYLALVAFDNDADAYDKIIMKKILPSIKTMY